MNELNETNITNNETSNSNSEYVEKVDLAKVQKYEEQVIESVEATNPNTGAVDESVDLSKVNVDLSKNDNVSNQQYQQSYQQQQYQQNIYQQQYANHQYNNQQQYASQQYANQQYNQGYQQGQPNVGIVTPDKLSVEPTMACILSIVFTGLGQMINGQLEKGLLLLFGGMGALLFISFITCGFGAVLSPLLIVVSALDAYKCAQRLQAGQSLGKYEFHIFD